MRELISRSTEGRPTRNWSRPGALGSATEASRAARAWSTAASIAPRSTGSPGTPVGTTFGRAGQIRAASAATRDARTAPPDHAGTSDHQRGQPGDIHLGAGAGPLDDPADQLHRVVGAVGVDAHIGDTAARDVRYRGADQIGFHVQAGYVGA